MPEAILGISAFYHDSAAALLLDGQIVAAAQEERFSRRKHDAAFPRQAIRYVLSAGGLGPGELSAVAYYEKPLLKFERILETFHAVAPMGLGSWLEAMPRWIKDRLFMRNLLRKELRALGGGATPPLYFPEHHLSHLASAFYPSPFEEAAILTIDGVGEWTCTALGQGRGASIRIAAEQRFPHSLGLLYAAFTAYLGFRVNSGEYKVMGLSSYGSRSSPRVQHYLDRARDRLVDLREDGSLLLNLNFFRFLTGEKMTHDDAWAELFGLAPRRPGDSLTQEHADLALAGQLLTEEAVGTLARRALAEAGSRRLVMAGGVALNSVANGRLLDLPELDDLWIQPAAGDAGGALGAALAVHHLVHGRPRTPAAPDAMRGAYLGPAFGDERLRAALGRACLAYERAPTEDELVRRIAQLLAEGHTVGWFQGRMEFGPRALGNRSILADARQADIAEVINRDIKFREGFRPFAPSVLEEDAGDYFALDRPSPYMLLVRPVAESRRQDPGPAPEHLPDRLRQCRSDLPGVTHVDYSARVQTVSDASNPRFAALLRAFRDRTGYGLLINTSFNVRGEPIVCTPEEAIACFLDTGLNTLVLGRFVVTKQELLEGLSSSATIDSIL